MIRRIARELLPESATPAIARFKHEHAAELELELIRAEAYQAALRKAEAEIAERMVGVLHALVGGELSTKPEHIRALVAGELTRLRRARLLKLRVHPEDAALLDEPATLQARHGLAGVLELERDPELERGGCMLESNLGEVDARIETRIELASALLASRVRR